MTESLGLAAFPPKVFAVVIELLAEESPGYLSGYEEDSLRRHNLALRARTLKNLSLVSEGIRRVAQPPLSQEVTIPWTLDIAVHRAQNLVRLLEARPESSTWFKTLHILPEALALSGAPMSLSISNLLSHINGLQSLKLLSLSAVVVDSPPQLFASITDLEIVAIQDLADLKNFMLVLMRCRNLRSLTVDFCAVAFDIEFPKTSIPYLARLTVPIMLAKTIIPGRPIERLEVSLSPDVSPLSCTPDDLKLLAAGSVPLRRLSFPLIQWSEDWFAILAPLFPSLRRLSVLVKWSQREWLPNHLASVVSLFPCLRSIKVTAHPPIGPPSDEELDEQLRILREAWRVQPRLNEVAFLEDVVWAADHNGFWTAVYRNYLRRVTHLTCSPEMQPQARAHLINPGINLDDHLSSLPTEILLHIVLFLAHKSSADIVHPYYPSRNLKALCLANTAMSSLVQPILFARIELSGEARIALFVARKLERVFKARAGSANWVLQLSMSWEQPRMRNLTQPLHDEAASQLEELIGHILPSMCNMRTLYITHLKIPYFIWTQIYRLPRLTKVSARGVVVTSPPAVIDFNIDTLPITDLTVDNRQPRSDSAAVDPCVIKLAKSPRLKRFHVWQLSTHNVADILGSSGPDSSLSNLTELEIGNSASPFDTVISLATHSPILRKVSLGSAHREMTPTTLPSEIASDIWPQLKEFYGFLEAGHILVPGRPVEKIMIKGSFGLGAGWDRAALLPLARGSAVVKELNLQYLPWHDEYVEHIASLFPQLDVLEVASDAGLDADQTWLAKNLLRVVKLFPQLRRALISVGPAYPPPTSEPECLQESNILPLLQDASSICPSLRTVFFTPFVRWDVFDGVGWRRMDPSLIGQDLD